MHVCEAKWRDWGKNFLHRLRQILEYGQCFAALEIRENSYYGSAKCEMEGKEPKRAFNVPEIEAFPPPPFPHSPILLIYGRCGCVRYGGGGL